MSDGTKSLLRPDYSDAIRYRSLSNGAIQDKQTGKIVTIDPAKNPYTITPDTARGMQKKSTTARRIREMRGLARGRGIELPPDADLETIANAAGDAWEALIAHTYEVFMKSTNIRGMGEIIPKLASAFAGDEESNETKPYNPQIILLLAELSRRKDAGQRGEIVDAESDG